MWEYAVYVFGNDKKRFTTPEVEEKLDLYGKQNWELMHFSTQPDSTIVCVFKRLRGIDGPIA